MKIVIIGGTGLIGKKLVKILKAQGHDVVAASPSTGVDTTTGKGLKEVLKGAQVVIDVANTQSLDEKSAVEFFEKSSRNLSLTEKEAGVKHHVVLSIVGTDRLGESGYMRAKYVQEKLIKSSGLPYSIIESTQFYEFLSNIADSATSGQTVRLPPVSFQPIAAEDVASILADVAVKPPINMTIEIAGPKRGSFPDIIEEYLKAMHDPRNVVADDNALYYGMVVTKDSLVPSKKPRLGSITLEDYARRS